MTSTEITKAETAALEALHAIIAAQQALEAVHPLLKKLGGISSVSSAVRDAYIQLNAARLAMLEAANAVTAASR